MEAQQFKSSVSEYSGIILPFTAKWHESVTNNTVRAVFRKKGPSSKAKPKWAFAYFGSPFSALCARLSIVEILRLPVHQAIEYCEEGHISEAALRKYAGDTKDLTVFRISNCIAPQTTLGMNELKVKFGFQPSPNFVALSDEGVKQLNLALKIKETS